MKSVRNDVFAADSSRSQKLDVIIETDMGGDKDDQASFVRWLLYTCDWDVKGIIFDRADDRFQSDGAAANPTHAKTTMEMAYCYLDAYGQVYANLIKHNPDYPSVDYLKSVSVHGTNDSNAGRDLIINAVDGATHNAPVWYGNWGSNSGTTSNLKRALDYIESTRSSTSYKVFISKIRVVTLDGRDRTKQGRDNNIVLHIETGYPQLGDDAESRWYRRFDNITAQAGGFNVQEDVLRNHGPLGALYTGQKEGDSWTFIYLIPNGLNDPDQPGWGSWAGRYGVRDGGSEVPHREPFYWANQEDDWGNCTNRDNTAKRFAAAIQMDFKARMDWCVRSFKSANHPPIVLLNGDDSNRVLFFDVKAGDKLGLKSEGSRDPDGGKLSYLWWAYPEAGAFSGDIEMDKNDAQNIIFNVPENADGKSIHIICEVTDDGEPPWTRYRRAVINVQD